MFSLNGPINAVLYVQICSCFLQTSENINKKVTFIMTFTVTFIFSIDILPIQNALRRYSANCCPIGLCPNFLLLNYLNPFQLLISHKQCNPSHDTYDDKSQHHSPGLPHFGPPTLVSIQQSTCGRNMRSYRDSNKRLPVAVALKFAVRVVQSFIKGHRKSGVIPIKAF